MLKFLVALVISNLGFSHAISELETRCNKVCSDCSKLPNKMFCLDKCSRILNTESCRATQSAISRQNDFTSQANIDFNEKMARLMQAYPNAQLIIKKHPSLKPHYIITPPELEELLLTLSRILQTADESLSTAIRSAEASPIRVKLQHLQRSSQEAATMLADSKEAAEWLKLNWSDINSHFEKYNSDPEMMQYTIGNIEEWADSILGSIKSIYIEASRHNLAPRSQQQESPRQVHSPRPADMNYGERMHHQRELAKEANSFNVSQRSQRPESLQHTPIPHAVGMDYNNKIAQQMELAAKERERIAHSIQDNTSKADSGSIKIKSCFMQCRASVCGKDYNVFSKCMQSCPEKTITNCMNAAQAKGFLFNYRMEQKMKDQG